MDRWRWPRGPTHHQRRGKESYLLTQVCSFPPCIDAFHPVPIWTSMLLFPTHKRTYTPATLYGERRSFKIPWSPLPNSCAQYSSPAGVGLRLSWWQVIEDVEGKTVTNKHSTDEERWWKGDRGLEEERSGSYGDEGSSSLSGVTGRPCTWEMDTIY